MARLRFSSWKFGLRTSHETWRQSSTASSSSLGGSLTTGPKIAGPVPPSSRIVGTPKAPTSAATRLVLVPHPLPGGQVVDGLGPQAGIEPGVDERALDDGGIGDVLLGVEVALAQRGVERTAGPLPHLVAHQHRRAQGGGRAGTLGVEGVVGLGEVVELEAEDAVREGDLPHLLEPAGPAGGLPAPRADRVEVEADGIGHG